MVDLNVGVIVTIVVAFLLAAILFPIAMEYVANETVTNTTGWSPPVVTMFTVLLPILVIIGVALVFVPSGKVKGKR